MLTLIIICNFATIIWHLAIWQSMNIGNGRNQAEHGKVVEKALHGDNQELRDYKNGCVLRARQSVVIFK